MRSDPTGRLLRRVLLAGMGLALFTGAGCEGDSNVKDEPSSVTYDFEDGTISDDFLGGGGGFWKADGSTSDTGLYSARAGNIGDGELSCLFLIPGFSTASIDFSYRVSSEPGLDLLDFYINEKFQKQWSGSVSWASKTFTHDAGEVTYSWCYVKDDLVAVGKDTAWLDDIVIHR